MMIEKFIASYARKKNENYLQFGDSADLTIPPSSGNLPTLLYGHIPFCEELCPYCSFHRMVFEERLARSYFAAFRQEILMYRELGYDFKALYIGGGTPTVLMDELEQMIGLIRKEYSVSEISVETNPNHLTPDNMTRLKDMGINRLSVGVQTLDDGLLQTVQRYHKYGSGGEIVERLHRAQDRFDTLNVDMIFNFPTQTMEMLEKDLQMLIDIGVDQITYYPLMVSAYTEGVMRKKLGKVDYSRGNKLYMRIMEMLAPAYKASTAWCFSRNDSMIDEYVVEYDEYAGLGSGAIGYLGGSAYANTFDIGEYIDKVNRGAFPVIGKKVFSMKERFCYDFLMKLFGLRLDLSKLGEKHGIAPYRFLWAEILFFIASGGLEKNGKILSLTKKGRYYWVLLMREFFIGVNNFRDFCRAQTNKE